MKLVLISFLGSVALSNAALITMSSCSVRNGVQTISDSKTGTTSASTACDATTGNGATAHLSASASYGSLGIQMQAFLRNQVDLSPTSAFVSGSASYTDTITVLGSGSGSIRTSLVYDLFSIDGFGRADFTLGSYTAPPFFVSSMGNGFVTAQVPIVFGSPVPIFASLQGSGGGSLTSTTTGAFRFGQSFEVLDASGNRLAQYQYTSDSNAAHPLTGGALVVVPEPLSWITALSGIAVIGLLRRRNS